MAKKSKIFKTRFIPTNGKGSRPDEAAADGMLTYEVQYHKAMMIDVRHLVEMTVERHVGDGQWNESIEIVPCGVHGEPKPWGPGEQSGDFRIERIATSVKDGEKYRAASMVYAAGVPDEETTNNTLLRMVLERKDDPDFRARLKAVGVVL